MNKKLILSYLLGITLIIFLIYSYRASKRDNEILLKYGKKANAVVVDIKKKKRGIDLKYKYFINNKYYEVWDKVYKEYSEGDTITIIYYPNDPSLSRINIKSE